MTDDAQTALVWVVRDALSRGQRLAYEHKPEWVGEFQSADLSLNDFHVDRDRLAARVTELEALAESLTRALRVYTPLSMADSEWLLLDLQDAPPERTYRCPKCGMPEVCDDAECPGWAEDAPPEEAT
jgi:hypothetical protein